jgi:hypothetical protein
MRHSHEVRARQALHYALDALHALPCGCVAAVYRAQPIDMQLVAVEARGPHCVDAQHQIGRVLGVSESEANRLSR